MLGTHVERMKVAAAFNATASTGNYGHMFEPAEQTPDAGNQKDIFVCRLLGQYRGKSPGKLYPVLTFQEG